MPLQVPPNQSHSMILHPLHEINVSTTNQTNDASKICKASAQSKVWLSVWQLKEEIKNLRAEKRVSSEVNYLLKQISVGLGILHPPTCFYFWSLYPAKPSRYFLPHVWVSECFPIVVAYQHRNMWDFSLGNLCGFKFTFRFLPVYPDHKKCPNLLHIRFPHHSLQALLPFPRTTYKITYTLLRPFWTPTRLAKHQTSYPPWQLLLLSLWLASFYAALLPAEQMCGLVGEFSPSSFPLLLPFSVSSASLCFILCTSRESVLHLWELQEEMALNFQQNVLLGDRETANIENSLIWW